MQKVVDFRKQLEEMIGILSTSLNALSGFTEKAMTSVET